MGFYSFYRIFKDIIRTLFGNKAFKYFLIFVIFCVLILFANKSFCADLRPWNVYTNTTEFNWNKLTFMNYTDTKSNFVNYCYEFKSNEVYYLYNPNSSTGSLRVYCYVSNDNNMILSMSEHIPQYSWLDLETLYQYSGGYIDIPFNTLFTPQFSCTLDINSPYELYMLDDQYSNIENYNELSALATDLRDYFYGSDLKPLSFDSVSGIGTSTSNNTFISNSPYVTKYFPVKNGYKYNVTFNYLSSETASADMLRFGYCANVPSVNGSFNNIHKWDYISYSTDYTFTSTYDGYAWFSYRNDRFNNFSVSSNYSSDLGGGINQQIINQGQETRETLTDSSISQTDTDYNLPVDNTNDITSDGFAHIFERIRTAFTTTSTTSLVFTVPFTNKSITVSYDTVYSNANLGVVRDIFQAFWNFIIALWITKDIAHKFNKIKSGNLEFAETTNIKEEIL